MPFSLAKGLPTAGASGSGANPALPAGDSTAGVDGVGRPGGITGVVGTGIDHAFSVVSAVVGGRAAAGRRLLEVAWLPESAHNDIS